MGRAGRGPIALAAALLLIVSSGVGVETALANGPTGAGLEPAVAGPAASVLANVTWNGVNVGRAGSAGGAFVLGAGQSAMIGFNYTEPVGTPAVVNATVVLLYVGLALSSESIAPTSVGPFGTAQMSWTFGSLIYLTEGIYQLEAELLDANGSALFHQAFFVVARAPYLVGSVIFVMVILLIVVEALWIRTVIRHRRARTGRYRYR
jgi:hypothetical protein